MKRCPITYQSISENEIYSHEGIKKISRKLKSFNIFPYNAMEQRQQARLRANKISIQGVHPKLSVRLNYVKSIFEITDRGGHFIIKPQSEDWPQLPENEDLSMRLAEIINIETPVHGLMLSADKTYTYFIKRMDRYGHKGKLPLEDFAQLTGKSRDTKYDYSMEKIVLVIEKFCTFPLLEKKKLFERTIFNYLIGNEDMHLKNFSIITKNNVHALSPAYDLVNSTLVLKPPHDDIALSLYGRKRNLRKKDLLLYFPFERLRLNEKIVNKFLEKIQKSFSEWQNLIEICFLSDHLKEKYWNIVQQKRKVLNL